MHHHRGNTEDHKRWKREGSSYFKAQYNLMILGLILSNALNVNSIIENWPYKPDNWTPVTIGIKTAKRDEEILTLTKTLTTPEGSEEAEDAEVPLEALPQEQVDSKVDSKVEPTPSQLWDVEDVLYTDTKRDRRKHKEERSHRLCEALESAPGPRRCRFFSNNKN